MKSIPHRCRRALSALLLALAAMPLVAHADLNIFTTVPEWGALVNALGGDKVKNFTATAPLQDPHHIQARPSLIGRARNAQLVVATGAELEIGWLPVVLRDSGNPDIQENRPGLFEAARYVRLLDIPASVDRSMGDVHAQGNPHIQTDPRNLVPIARALAQRMGELDPANRDYYDGRLQAFLIAWEANLARWAEQARPLQGVRIWAQHDGFPYLNDWLGLKQVGTLEPRPGVDPSVAYLGEVLQRQKTLQGQMIITAAYQSDSASKWFSERTGLPVVVLPFTVGGTPEAKSREAFYGDTIARLLAALAKGGKP